MPDLARPNPDALLASIQREDFRTRRGRLQIFLGMAPGVGKTYAMLKDAHQRDHEGVAVVVGYVETHKRAETQALIEGLIVAPRRQVEYRGVTMEEMDLDGIIFLRPQLVLVDELAHTNAEGSRHPKRHQDILELLERLAKFSDSVRRHGGDFESFLAARKGASGKLPSYLVKVRDGNEEWEKYFDDETEVRQFHEQNLDLALFDIEAGQ